MFHLLFHFFPYIFILQSLAREPQVLKQGLQMLKEVLEKLEPLNHPLQPPEGSILLKELLDSPNPPEAPLSAGATPLLHSVVSAHSYVTMLYHVCKVGQVSLPFSDIFMRSHVKDVRHIPTFNLTQNFISILHIVTGSLAAICLHLELSNDTLWISQ